MANREIHLELLLGKRVLDSTGKSVGHIQEVRSEHIGDEWVVQEYLIGAAALVERLSAWRVALGFGKSAASKISRGYRVHWDKLDLTDPDHPRLYCTVDELQQFSHQPQDKE